MVSVKYELEKLEELERELRRFCEDLDRADDVEPSRELELKRRIKELINDGRDILESCWQTYYTSSGGDSSLKREIYSFKSDRLEPVRRMIEAYEDLLLKQKEPSNPNQAPSVHLNKETAPIRLNKVVGFEDEVETLINNLTQETEELEVIPITGMPGIGKTTLAWKIYQNDKIRNEFPTRIWIDVPFCFSITDLCLDILKEFFKQGIISSQELVISLGLPQESSSKVSYLDTLNELKNNGQLVSGVQACLEKSKFLLVMDGVWSSEYLRSVEDLLPKRGKVLFTTCNNRIARKNSHILRFLDEEESWKLLQLEVFGKLGDCPETLESTGKCIAKNCDGLPLAIVAVGSSLGVTASTVEAKYLNEKWWKKVSENVIVYASDYAQQLVFKSMELSYGKLTRSMKDCFLYLGVFPQGHDILVSTLLRLWVAERVVQSGEQRTIEETAEQTLYDLVDRNMVMVGEICPDGQIKTCHLHKVMYAFCKYKAAEQEFYHEIKMSGGGALGQLISLATNHRRLCVYSNIAEFLTSIPDNGRRITSILCLNKEEKEKAFLSPKHSCTIQESSYELLKVLECKNVTFAKFPKKWTKLRLLRYISLSCDHHNIPKTISSLSCLETLIVETQSPYLNFNGNIWRMPRLRHVVTKAAIVLSNEGKGEAGENLQTLTRLAPECCTNDVLTRASNLRTLGIRGHLAALSSAEAMSKSEHLENLKLMNEPAADGQLHSLINPNCFAPNVKKLTLSATCLEWETMSILGKIDSLKILKLKNNAFIGEVWRRSDADGFRRLLFLLIDSTDLVSWEAPPADSFPRLECLVLKNCEKLEKIPSTLAKTMDRLDVENVSESAMESARDMVRVQGQQEDRLNGLKLIIRRPSE